MADKATLVNEQIALLKNRGMSIENLCRFQNEVQRFGL